MDRITKSHLDTFKKEQAFTSIAESDLFEHFANYCVLSDAYDEEFDLADIHTGGGADLGLDGVVIVVNGVIVTTVDEVDDLLALNNFLDVQFVLIQAKTSGNFVAGEIGVFFDGVDEFFADTPTLPMSDRIKDLRVVMAWLYDHSVKFTRHKPALLLSYVTTGKWTNDAHVMGKVKKRIKTLDDTGLFGRVSFTPQGANEIQASYQRSRNSVTVEFTFANRVTLPDIVGVDEAYLGILPISEYLNLITDPAGAIRKQLFYDNVRDFQGDNSVNREINQTLQSAPGQQRFAVLNNGITLVARGLRTTGNKFAVTDYQIVNGCQTSHVLFESSPGPGTDVSVPLKVIATTDEDLINSIITATNRQTQVTEEDLYALSTFQKRLEALYESYPDKKKLFYERRSRQYSAVPGIEKVRIVGKTQQVRSFAAMFLDDAHRAARYYSDLKAQVGTKIFHGDHKLEPYYTAAFGYYKLEYLFRNGMLPVYYKPARYHLLMAFRYIVADKDMPAMTANKVATYSNQLCDVLWNDDLAVEAFKTGIGAIDVALNGSPCTRDVVKTQSFTDAVRSAALVP